jgi:epoxyqueuosine reductase
MITSSQIKSLAASLGFDACGIVAISGGAEQTLPWQEETEQLRQWVEGGCHGEMKYLEDFETRAKRFWDDFPGAKSVIVLGVNYYSHPRNDESQKGRIARYAWGKDYHRAIRKRLEEFHSKLSELAGREVRAEICVDTKPLLERSLAQRAGLGFIGKQSQLLSPKFGPWLFLAELVTNLELEPDLPFTGSCGSCTVCIDECPTEAIRPEGGIDARRCIAYLTIEHKTKIPEALRPLVGDWVFGCDICLQVCPHASKSKETRWPELRPESGRGERFDLLKLFEIPSNRAYKKEFEETAVTRVTRKQLLRNAAVVLGNLKAKSALPALRRAAAEEGEVVASHAQWAIDQIDSKEDKG